SNQLQDEIVPVEVKGRKETVVVTQDEHPRPNVKKEKLGELRTINKEGTVTAGNASGINDGASAVLLMSEKKAIQLGLTPLATIESFSVAGVDPAYMGIGPVPAVRKA